MRTRLSARLSYRNLQHLMDFCNYLSRQKDRRWTAHDRRLALKIKMMMGDLKHQEYIDLNKKEMVIDLKH